MSLLLLSGCIKKGPNPADPYEAINRPIHRFNMAFDATFLKPPAKLYKAILPGSVRKSINNFYETIYLIPTVANDLLQADLKNASNDTGRFVINATLGVGGLFDIASVYHIPPHYTDLGLTFAKWGDTHSPYIVIPFLGPSTIRDGMAMMFEYTFLTPYPYINNDAFLYSLLGIRYVDLRSQYLDSEKLLEEALDSYSFLRDAYLQHRQYQLANGNISNEQMASDYLEE